MKGRDKIGFRRTVIHTSSSNVFKDPYNPKAPFIKKITNWFLNFYYLRQIETEFVDFKTHSILPQTREIYNNLRIALNRSDRVVLRRSLSDPMYNYCEQLLSRKDENSPQKIHDLLLSEARKMQIVQARVYAADDYLKPDEVWA